MLLWVGKFDRPRFEDTYTAIEDIRRHRCFLALAPTKLKIRLHDCWCMKCRLYNTGVDTDGVAACPHAAEWPLKNRDVYREQAAGVRADRGRLEEMGKQLAEKVNVGDIVAVQYVQARGRRGDASRDLYWLGVVVNQGNGRGTYQVPVDREINGMGFQKGEIAVAVRWLEREANDDDRLTFRMGDDDKAAYGQGEACLYFNAAHLRAIALQHHMTCITPKVKGRDTRSAMQRRQQARWRLHDSKHTDIEKKCFY